MSCLRGKFSHFGMQRNDVAGLFRHSFKPRVRKCPRALKASKFCLWYGRARLGERIRPSISKLEQRQLISLCLDGDLKTGIFWVGIATLQYIGPALVPALFLNRSRPAGAGARAQKSLPFDQHMVMAGRRAFPQVAAHQLKGPILLNDTKNQWFLPGLAALTMEGNDGAGRRRSLVGHFTRNRIKLIIAAGADQQRQSTKCNSHGRIPRLLRTSNQETAKRWCSASSTRPGWPKATRG